MNRLLVVASAIVISGAALANESDYTVNGIHLGKNFQESIKEAYAQNLFCRVEADTVRCISPVSSTPPITTIFFSTALDKVLVDRIEMNTCLPGSKHRDVAGEVISKYHVVAGAKYDLDEPENSIIFDGNTSDGITVDLVKHERCKFSNGQAGYNIGLVIYDQRAVDNNEADKNNKFPTPLEAN